MDAPQIKLLTLWMLEERRRPFYSEPDSHVISHGVWETHGVEVTDRGRLYTMVCRWPMHRNLKVGDKIKMLDWLLIEMCNEVKIVAQPKLPSMVKRVSPPLQD